MLLNLCIKDYILIDYLSIVFGPGLNILTGETGAGKSIIIDAINIIIGERAYTDFIRAEKENASVEAVFDYENAKVDDILKEYGVEPENNTLIISREISIKGRSISRLNGKMVPASALKRVGKELIDIHGQHRHQSLLDSKNHMQILDAFGYDNISKSKDIVRNLYKKHCQIQKKISHLERKYEDFCLHRDRLKYEVDELEKAQLKPDEEEILKNDIKILENAESIFGSLEYAYNLLYQGYETTSIIDNLNNIINKLEGIINYYKPIYNIHQSLKNILYELEDISSTIRNMQGTIDFDVGKLNMLNARLELLDRLKSKYSKSISELLEYKVQATAELDKAFNMNEQIDILKDKATKIKQDLSKSAVKLHSKRKALAKNLEQSISRELRDLGMKNVIFKVEITIQEDLNGVEVNGKKIRITEEGFDNIEFLISTNPGEPLKPLAKIISGGESSRIMLALKNILARVDNIPCLIFDEIDAGIDGRTAQIVGEKLSKLSDKRQVLCVTHSPQIASLGDKHFLIRKKDIDGKTFTNVNNIKDKDRIEELARMLGGAKITENTLTHAKEMLNMARNIKNKL